MTSTRISQFSREGLVFDAIDTGPLDSGELPVVLLHGFPESAASWAGVTAILNENGLRTVAPDQRGYSPGARPPHVRDYRMSELVDDVLALIDTLGVPKVHLVSHDWGSGVAWVVAAQHPDRVASLTALAVPHPRAFIWAMPRGQALRSWYMVAMQVPVIPEWTMSKLAPLAVKQARKAGREPSLTSRLAAEAAEAGILHGGANWYRALRFDNGMGTPKVSVPTTYIWGDRDRYLSRAGARRCSDTVTGPYEFIVLRGADHWMPQKRTAEIAEAVLARIKSVRV